MLVYQRVELSKHGKFCFTLWFVDDLMGFLQNKLGHLGSWAVGLICGGYHQKSPETLMIKMKNGEKNHASVASTQKKHHRNPEGILSAWRKSITFFCGFLYTRNQRLRLNDARHPGRTWHFFGFGMSPPTVFPRLGTLKKDGNSQFMANCQSSIPSNIFQNNKPVSVPLYTDKPTSVCSIVHASTA